MENYVNGKQFDVVVCERTSSVGWGSLECPSNLFFVPLEGYASPIGPLSHCCLNISAYNVPVGQVKIMKHLSESVLKRLIKHHCSQ